MSRLTMSAAALACGIAYAFPAFGHAKLEPAEAAEGSTYRGAVRIGHGCEGAATLKVRLLVPDGVTVAPPAPPEGWSVETVRGTRGHHGGHGHGSHATPGQPVAEIVWTGRLPDKAKGEFPFEATLPAGRGSHGIPFPVIQECEKGEHRWVEVAEQGQSHKDLKSPAPVLKLTPAGAQGAVAAAAKHHLHIHGEKAMADVVLEPRAARLTVVPMTMDFAALDATAVTVTFAQAGAAPLERAVTRTAEGPWTAEAFALPRAGRWTVTLAIRLATGETLTLRDTLDVAGPAS